MSDRFMSVDLTESKAKHTTALKTSVGSADADKIVATGPNGKLDASLMPDNIGADALSVEASEALAAGDLVNVWNDGGTVKVRKADASASGTEATGFVKDNATAGSMVTVFFEGVNSNVSSLTPGARLFLSKDNPGEVVESVTGYPTNSLFQPVGKAVSATAFSFEPAECVVL